MSTGRNPNTGPYVVTYRNRSGSGVRLQRECQTWAQACALMRGLLIAGYVCEVDFA